MVRITRVLSFAEYVAMQDEALARGWYRNDRRMFVPGTAWYQPFYYDPFGEIPAYRAAHPEVKRFRPEAMIAEPPADPTQRQGTPGNFLSQHYWRDWSAKRPPIAVVCPNGCEWEIDRWSSNGTGWTVTGELPSITCSPSIVCGDYHGFLRNGEFTASL